jgi:Uma2 family endonuclease
MSIVADTPALALAPPPPEPSIRPCSIVLAGDDVLTPPSAHTLAGFRAWAKSEDFPERGRISFIDKVIFIDMSPEELETHGKVKAEITFSIVGLNKKRKRGIFCPDGTLVTNVTANLATEPDGSFITYESLDGGRVRLVPRQDEDREYIEVEGSPDWILEIVSKSSVRKDTQDLRERYHRAHIPEYWLVNAREKDIDFQVLLWGDADYVPAPRRRGWQRSAVFGRWFCLTRKRNRRGFWDYTLQIKTGR